MPETAAEKSRWRALARDLLVCLLAVCLVTGFVLAVQMAATRAVVRETDPLNQVALTHLKQAAARHAQDDDLKEAFRDIDERAREGFYRARGRQRRGAMLLGGIGLTALLSMHLLARLMRTPPRPGQTAAEADPVGAMVRRGTVAAALAAGVFFVVLAQRQGDAVPAAADDAAEAGQAFDADPTQWPGFRGAGGDGRAPSPAVTDWDGPSGRGVLWKRALPRGGFSSAIVWDDRVYLTGGDTVARELYCLDAADGRMLWTVAATDVVGSPAVLPEVSPDTGFAAATPVTDGQRVMAIFATGDVLAVDRDGQRLWARNLGVPDNPYGHASSLRLHAGRLLVQYDHFASARFLALDAGTGATVWEQPREVHASWATPLLVRLESRVAAVLNAEPLAEAFDAETGERLWSCQCMGGEVAPSPAYDQGLAFVTTDYVTLAAIRMTGDPVGSIAWQNDEELPDVCTPLAIDGLLIVANGAGIISCYRSTTGELLWRQETDEGYYSSPVAAGDLVYLTDRKGRTRIFKAAPTFIPVAECVLGEEVVSTPAIVQGRLYLRGVQNLYCLGNPP